MDMSSNVGKAPKTKQERGSNWNSEEKKKLLELVALNRRVILGKFSNDLTGEDKSKAWQDIAEQVVALGYSNRSKEQVRKKWADLLSDAKKEYSRVNSSIKATGGGPPSPKMSDTCNEVISIVGEEAFLPISNITPLGLGDSNIHTQHEAGKTKFQIPRSKPSYHDENENVPEAGKKSSDTDIHLIQTKTIATKGNENMVPIFETPQQSSTIADVVDLQYHADEPTGCIKKKRKLSNDSGKKDPSDSLVLLEHQKLDVEVQKLQVMKTQADLLANISQNMKDQMNWQKMHCECKNCKKNDGNTTGYSTFIDEGRGVTYANLQPSAFNLSFDHVFD